MTLTRPTVSHPELDALLATPRLNFIGGAWEGAARTMPLINPAAASEVLGHFPVSGGEEVARAVAAARAALPAWRAMPAPERAARLTAALRWLEERRELLARAMAWEAGKVLAEARVEVKRGLTAWEYLVGEGRRQEGRTVPAEAPGTFTYTVRRSLGVVGLITPWNFPFAIPAWKLAPALVTGNTVVLKPAEQAPLSATLIVAALEAAGVPPGVINLVHGDAEAGAALVRHPEVRAVSFTGSTVVGKEVNQAAAGRLAKVQLELGGKNAAIVLADADLELAARQIALGAWGTTGQRCTATSRVLVERSVAPALVRRLTELASELVVGPPLDEANTMGPLIEEAAVTRVLGYIQTASAEGATLVTGGERLGGALADGYFVAPTLLTGVQPGHTVATEEIFGPVLAVLEVDGFEQAMAIANDVRYGLSSAIYTRDLATCFRYAAQAETGLLHVNQPTIYSEAHLPFGGMKESGFGGREMGATAIDFYTEWQTMYLHHGG